MSGALQPELDFEAADHARESGDALVLDLDGFEGPLDVLLSLARRQKVDLLHLSITSLADQYLAFVREAGRTRFALAADYLVMAAWLTYLKSRLLLPKPERAPVNEPPAEALAAALAFRLAKLDAVRRAMEALQSLPQKGRDVFTRGDPEAITVQGSDRLDVHLQDLVAAYIRQRTLGAKRSYRPDARVEAYPLDAARDRLQALEPMLERWTALTGLAPGGDAGGPSRASCLASTFSAGLELIREGRLEARQLEAFSDVFLRTRRSRADAAAAA